MTAREREILLGLMEQDNARVRTLLDRSESALREADSLLAVQIMRAATLADDIPDELSREVTATFMRRYGIGKDARQGKQEDIQ